MWWTSDEDVNFLIEFKVDNEFIIPTSAYVTVRDDNGIIISGLENSPLVATSTSDTLTIPAANNAVAAEKSFENRYISVFFVFEGKSYNRVLTYKITSFIPLTTSAEDVRRELGLDSSEAPDRDIDIFAAYFLLEASYGSIVTDNLVLGNEKTLAINQAVAVRAAMELVNGMQFRAAVKMKSENSAFDRMASFDVPTLRLNLAQRLSSLLNIAEGIEAEGTTTLVLSVSTDAITGV